MSLSTINRVAVRGLKVEAMELALGRLNLILGPVGSGKSSIADALQFAGLGYVARVGLAAAATAKLMRGDRAEVELGFAHDDAPQTVFRRLQRDGSSLVGDAAASWLPPKMAPTEAGDVIRQLFGATEAEAAQNLDVSRLLSAPAGALAAAVEKLLDAAGLDPDAVEREARKLFKGRVDTLRPNVDGVLGELSREVVAAYEAALPQMVDRARRSLPDAVTWARDQKNLAAADAKQARAAAAEAKGRLAELKAPAEASADLRARRGAAADARREIEARLKIRRQGAAARAEADAKVEATRRDAELAVENLATRREAAKRAPQLRAEASVGIATPLIDAPVLRHVDGEAVALETADLRRKLEALTAPAEPVARDMVPSLPHPAAVAVVGAALLDELKAAEEALGKASARLHELRTTTPAITPIDAEERAVAEAERALTSALASPWREVEEVASQIDADTKDYEAQTTRLYRLAREHGRDRSALESALARAKERLAQATLLRDGTTVEYEEHVEAVRAAGKAEEAAAKRVAELKTAIEATIAAENKRRRDADNEEARAYMALLRGIAADRERLRAEIATVERIHQERVDGANRVAQADHLRRVTAAREESARQEARRRDLLAEAEQLEHAVLRAERMEREVRAAHEAAVAARDAAEAVLPLDEAAATAESAELAAQIKDLDARLEVVGKAEALRDELDRVVRKGEAAEASREVYAAAEWALTRVRDEDLRTRAGALEEPMRRFLATIPDAGEPMVRAEKSKVQLGLRYADRFVDAAALSGGQAALFRAGLGYAVLMARKPILRVLHIELAEACDGSLEDQFLRACEAVSHEVQVIVTTCVPISVPDESRGWTVVRMGREAVTHVA